jgi:hypothetical protein
MRLRVTLASRAPACAGSYNLTTNSRTCKRLFTLSSRYDCRLSPVQLAHSQERSMTTSGNLRITLTPEQKEQVRKATGKEAEAVELSIEELEERIAPMRKKGLGL